MKVGDRGTLDKQLTAEQRAEGVNCLFMPSTMVYDIIEVINESEIKVRACGQIVSDIVPSSVFDKNTYAESDVNRDFPLKKKARNQSSEEKPKQPAPLHEAIDIEIDCCLKNFEEDDKEICDIVRDLIEEGEDVNYQLVESKEMWYPLHVAVDKGFQRVTRLLLENGASVNAKKIHGKTALHMASECGELDCVKVLLEFGADLNIQDEEGMTALHHTIENGAFDVAEWLIKNGADPYIKNKKGYSFFQDVSCTEEDDIFRLEMVYAETSGTKLLYPAIRAEDKSEKEIHASVEALLKKGEDASSMDVRERCYVLDHAIRLGFVTVTRLLLENGASVNPKNTYYYTGSPLHTACEEDTSVSMVKVLIEFGADLNKKDDFGETPLFKAVAEQKYAIAEVLIRKGADPYITNYRRKTFLDMPMPQKVMQRMKKAIAEVRDHEKVYDDDVKYFQDDKVLRHKDAATIQRIYRGHIARKRMKELKEAIVEYVRKESGGTMVLKEGIHDCDPSFIYDVFTLYRFPMYAPLRYAYKGGLLGNLLKPYFSPETKCWGRLECRHCKTFKIFTTYFEGKDHYRKKSEDKFGWKKLCLSESYSAKSYSDKIFIAHREGICPACIKAHFT